MKKVVLLICLFLAVWPEILKAQSDSLVALYLEQAIGYYFNGEDAPMYDALMQADSIRKSEPNLPIGLGTQISDFLGVYFNRIGDAHLSLFHYQEALDWREQDTAVAAISMAINYNNLGTASRKLGDYNQALDYYLKADAMHTQMPRLNPNLSFSIYKNLGLANKGLDHVSRARAYFGLALNLVSNKERAEVGTKLIDIHHELASLALQSDQTDSALYWLGKNEKLLVDPEDPWEDYYNNYSHAYLASGAFDLAYEYTQKALDQYLKRYGPRFRFVREMYHRLGLIETRRKRYAAAFPYYQQALGGREDVDELKCPDLDQVSKEFTLVYWLSDKAEALIAYAAIAPNQAEILQAALLHYQEAAALIDDLRLDYKNEASKQFLLKDTRKFFESAIELAVRLYEEFGEKEALNQAFAFAEKSRAVLLLAGIREHEALQFAGVPAELIQKDRELRMQRSYYENQFRNLAADDSLNRARWQQQLFEVNQAYQQHSQLLETQYQDYYDLKYKTDVADIQAVQARLVQNGESLIEYFWGEEKAFVFVINKQEAHVHQINSPNEMSGHIRQLQEILSQAPLKDDPAQIGWKQFLTHSWALYQALITPIAQELVHSNITLIPDGLLHYIPFEILIDSLPQLTEPDFRRLPYLLHRYEISYAFSASLQIENQSKGQSGTLNYLAFAPSFDAQPGPAELAFVRKSLPEGGLPALSGSLEEVAVLDQHFEGQSFVGAKATESQFKQLAADYDILMLATHALIDDANPMNSRFIFSIEDRISGDSLLPNEGDLYAWELYNLQLGSQLAILSACNTGFGQLQGGEGVMSLGRAFAYAGVPSIVMSLWPVQDQTTARIMQHYIPNLAAGMAKDAGLRAAKQSYLEASQISLSHPFYWAGLIMLGDQNPLSHYSPYLQWLLYGLGLILLIGGFYLFQKYRLKNEN